MRVFCCFEQTRLYALFGLDTLGTLCHIHSHKRRTANGRMKMICTTTLNKIRGHSPCQDGWKKLLAHLGKKTANDDLLTFQTILESNGLDDALWCLRASNATEFEMRRFARLAALDVAHLWDMPAIVREYLETGDETKCDAARDAARAAAQDAARAAMYAARAAWVAGAAWAAAWAAAQVAQDAARKIQTERFILMFCTQGEL